VPEVLPQFARQFRALPGGEIVVFHDTSAAKTKALLHGQNLATTTNVTVADNWKGVWKLSGLIRFATKSIIFAG